jgi:Zn-dependent membrane protease YugP
MFKVFGILALAVLLSAAFYGTTSLNVFTPTGNVVLATTGTSASAVLATNGLSNPTATTAIVTNYSANPAYVMFSATAASAVAASNVGFAIPAGAKYDAIGIRGAKYVAAMAASGTAATISVSTGY